MEAKRKLIDVGEFYATLEEIRMEYIEEDTLSSNFAAEVIETVQDEYLSKAPAVDAEEVVRCKDCIHCEKDLYCRCHRWMGHPQIVKEDDYCSYGESRIKDGKGNV